MYTLAGKYNNVSIDTLNNDKHSHYKYCPEPVLWDHLLVNEVHLHITENKHQSRLSYRCCGFVYILVQMLTRKYSTWANARERERERSESYPDSQHKLLVTLTNQTDEQHHIQLLLYCRLNTYHYQRHLYM